MVEEGSNITLSLRASGSNLLSVGLHVACNDQRTRNIRIEAEYKLEKMIAIDKRGRESMLRMSDAAKEYILAKKKPVYVIQNGPTGLCCGSVDFGPSVYLGNPPMEQEYTINDIDGIVVYLPQDFYTNVPLTIEVRSFFTIKSLYIEGWKVI